MRTQVVLRSLLVVCFAASAGAGEPAGADTEVLLSCPVVSGEEPGATGEAGVPGAIPEPQLLSSCTPNFCEEEEEACTAGCRNAFLMCDPQACSAYCVYPIVCID